MSAGNSTSHRGACRPADAAHCIEEQRVFIVGFVRIGGHAKALRSLELDLALRRLHILEKAIDDLLGADPLCFCRKIGKHTMAKNGMRDTENVCRRNCKATGKQSMSLGAQYQCLPRARTRSP